MICKIGNHNKACQVCNYQTTLALVHQTNKVTDKTTITQQSSLQGGLTTRPDLVTVDDVVSGADTGIDSVTTIGL